MFQSGQRRSERVLIDMSVLVRGKSASQLDFQEETFTVTVSAHGALLMLAARVALGQELVVVNPQNSDQREGRVAYLGAAHAGLAQVAVEFYKPAPEFWPIYPPPSDWSSI